MENNVNLHVSIEGTLSQQLFGPSNNPVRGQQPSGNFGWCIPVVDGQQSTQIIKCSAVFDLRISCLLRFVWPSK